MFISPASAPWASLAVLLFCSKTTYGIAVPVPVNSSVASVTSSQPPSTITPAPNLPISDQIIPVNTCSFFNTTNSQLQWNLPKCSIQAGTVQLTYWPTDTNYSYPATIYDPVLDYTFSSPSVYMVVNTIYGYNPCGPLGPTTSNGIFAFDLTDVSTLVPYTDETATTRRATRQLYLSDLGINCPMSVDTASLATNTHPTKNDEVRCNPHLAMPKEIKRMGMPYWLHCGNVDNKFGIFDPPYAIPTMGGFFPVTTTTTSAVTDKPEETQPPAVTGPSSVPDLASSTAVVPEAPQTTAPTDASPKPPATSDASPEPTTPTDASPEPTTPTEESPEPTTPTDVSPKPTTPTDVSPKPTTPTDVSPEPTIPAEASPEPTSPGEASPEPTPPVEGSPEPTSPDEGFPEPTSPVEGSPDPTPGNEASPTPVPETPPSPTPEGYEVAVTTIPHQVVSLGPGGFEIVNGEGGSTTTYAVPAIGATEPGVGVEPASTVLYQGHTVTLGAPAVTVTGAVVVVPSGEVAGPEATAGGENATATAPTQFTGSADRVLGSMVCAAAGVLAAICML